MFYAAMNGHIKALKMFMAKADVLSQNAEGATPICYAAEAGHVSAITAAIDAGGSVKARDHEGRTAMCYAARNGHVKAIEVLKDANASVSTRDEDGSTPIFYAAVNGHISAIKALMELGADASVRNLKGETLLTLAEKNQIPSDVKAALKSELAPRGGLLPTRVPPAKGPTGVDQADVLDSAMIVAGTPQPLFQRDITNKSQCPFSLDRNPAATAEEEMSALIKIGIILDILCMCPLTL
jgi:hypothetical protein